MVSDGQPYARLPKLATSPYISGLGQVLFTKVETKKDDQANIEFCL